MIHNIKSLKALTILFLCFFISSRYIQHILFDRDLNNSLISSLIFKESKCRPKSNSLLAHYKRNNKRIIFLILDGYPNQKLYKNITGSESLMHNYIFSNASEIKEGTTLTNSTWTSLPYLLARLDTKTRCRYPFLNGSFLPNIVIANRMIGSNKSICSSLFHSRNSFSRYKQLLRKRFDKDYQNFLAGLEGKCSIINKGIFSEIYNNISKNYNSLDKKNINLIHEITYHDYIDDISNLPEYDRLYYNSIKHLLADIKQLNLADEMIIMSDHGPRLEILYKEIKDDFDYNSPSDNNFYGYFIARFNIVNLKKSNELVLDNLVPSSKKRYHDNGLGKIELIKNFE